jgi:Txe/YoeB family toxin of Txe-Axe toxin-antitoxin module
MIKKGTSSFNRLNTKSDTSVYNNREMSYEDLENWKNHDLEITKMTSDLSSLIDSACRENYFGVEELEKIQNEMGIILQQGMFWLEQENPQRFVYDLKNFTLWLCNYLEEIEGQDE